MNEYPKVINHMDSLMRKIARKHAKNSVEYHVHNYYYLVQTLFDANRTLGVYESEYEDHPDRILHLELDEAKLYAVKEGERGYDGPVWG